MKKDMINSEQAVDTQEIKKRKSKKAIIISVVAVLSAIAVLLASFGLAVFIKKRFFDKQPDILGDLTVSYLEGKFTDIKVTDIESAVNAAVEGAEKLNVNISAEQLTELNVNRSEGLNYYRLQQNYEGIPVYGKSFVVIADDKGNAKGMTGNAVNVAVDSVEPTVTGKTAADAASEYYGEDVTVVLDNDELVIFVDDSGNATLAYDTTVYAADELMDTVIDAHSGAVLQSTSSNLYETAKGTAESGDDKITFNTSKQSDNNYLLIDEERNLSVYNANDSTVEKCHIYYYEDRAWVLVVGSNDLYDDQGNKWTWNKKKEEWRYKNKSILWSDMKKDGYYIDATIFTDTLLGKDPLEVDKNNSTEWEYGDATLLMNYAAKTYDFYKFQFSRIGFDGKNTDMYLVYNDLMSFDLFNAYHTKVCMPYFDLISIGTLTNIEIDIVAHEFTHGVERSISDMAYKGESGAIMEGISDVMGEMVEDYATDGKWDNSCNWTNGDRNMKNPGKAGYPSQYKGKKWGSTEVKSDNGNVHRNSTVISHSAYLMHNGVDGKQTALGNDEIAKLWYNTMFLLPADCTMSEFRQYMLITATNLGYSANKQRCVAATLDAVGVTNTSSPKRNNNSNTETTQNKPAVALTAEQAVDIYMSDIDVWMKNSDYSPMYGYNYFFLDLNFDGVLELIVNSTDGTARQSYNRYFTINTETNKVEELSAIIEADQDSSEEFGGNDYVYCGEIKLLANKTTGEMLYYCTDYTHVCVGHEAYSYGLVNMSENTVFTRVRFAEDFCEAGVYDNKQAVEKYSYCKDYKFIYVSKSEYDKMVKKFFDEHADLNLTWDYISGSDFDKESKSNQKMLLLKAYTAFSYKGMPSIQQNADQLVKPIYSESYTADEYEFIRDYYDIEKISYQVPEINLSSKDVERINKEIKKNFSFVYDTPWIMEVDEEKIWAFGSRGAWYEYSVNGDVLSLIVCNEGGLEPSDPVYYVYNVSVSTGKELTKSDVLKAMGSSNKQYTETLKAKLEWYASNYYTEECDYKMNDEVVGFIKDTVSDENINSCVPYINKDGSLCVVATMCDDHPTDQNIDLNKVQPHYAYQEYIDALSKSKEVFSALPSSFYFSSGVGGWGTEITVNDDGTFTGEYHDTDMGDTGSKYPNGTVYLCDFSGKFSAPVKKSKYIYSMKLEYIELAKDAGEEEIKDGTLYIYSEPYGFDDADEFYIYLPGCPISKMSEDFLSWSFIDTDIRTTMPMGVYGIYNVSGKQGFVGIDDDALWLNDYKYTYDSYKSELWPSYTNMSHLTFWPESGAAILSLEFEWSSDSQTEFIAEDYYGTGEYTIKLDFSDDYSSVVVTLKSKSGFDLEPWGGTSDGTLTAKYKKK